MSGLAKIMKNIFSCVRSEDAPTEQPKRTQRSRRLGLGSSVDVLPVKMSAPAYGSQVMGLRRLPRRKVKFLLDASTSGFRDAVVREGYEATRMEVAEASCVDVLRYARDGGMAVLTLNPEYARIAAEGNNQYGVLVLPECFLLLESSHEEKLEWLKQILNCHAGVDKIRFFPVRTYMPTRIGNEWKIEPLEQRSISVPVIRVTQVG